jgi:hypothetical protein
MKRPSFQFYPGDWRMDGNLRRCSHAARGAWMDILCVLHESEEYGVYRFPLADLAQTAGVPIKLARELAEKGVLRGADAGAEPCIFQPTHAGRAGAEVVLVEPGDGPCWYSKRFVKDEYIRHRRGNATRFSDENPPPKTKPKPAPKAIPKVGIGDGTGTWHGYGPSSSSSKEQEHPIGKSLARVKDSKLAEPEARAPDDLSAARMALIAAGLSPHVVGASQHPSLIELVQHGITAKEFYAVALELRERKNGEAPNIGHICATIRGRLVDAARRPPIPAGAALAVNGTHAPSKTRGAIEDLERLKHGQDLAPRGNRDGLPEIALLEPGTDAGA